MDYEKKYKEALKEAEKIHKFSSDIAEIKRIEQIFPELKESEDEKIRKALCKAIWTYIPTEEGQEYIAWLKKQGKTTDVDPVFSYNNLVTEKQGEQKSIIEMKTPEESFGITSKEYNKIVDECIYGDDEPAWSEEDKKISTKLFGLVKSCYLNGGYTLTIGEYNKYKKWLESFIK